MPDIKNTGSDTPPPSAADLRKTMLDEQMAEARKHDEQRKREEKKLTDFTEGFLKGQVTENEIATVRRLVMNAVKEGKMEALVYTFPSDLCSDRGRAINSNDPDWAETLQGKAKQFYQRYLAYGKPQGFKLKAMVINFPGGMPGDVGFYLNWQPPAR
jgi:hypothetical protein